LVLNPTHEEVVTPLAKKYTFSYRDLPFALFQIQTKFRNEPRAKSGLLRGREFSMKDLYSFHRDEADLDNYYEQVKKAYFKLFRKEPLIRAIHAGLECGLFLKKYPGLDMISFGPTIKGAHSPDERIHIESTRKFWELLIEVLKNIPARQD